MRKMLVGVVAALIGLGMASADVSAKSRVRVGVLSCGMEPGVGLIVVSQKRMSCVYQPSKGGRVERYRGKITRIGIDIGVTNQTVLVWGVFAPAKPKRGALQGSYGGVSAEATLIVGLGANALIGGFNRSIMLQPLSVQAQTGLDIAAGVAGMRLDYVK
jgi:hypothetical protein